MRKITQIQGVTRVLPDRVKIGWDPEKKPPFGANDPSLLGRLKEGWSFRTLEERSGKLKNMSGIGREAYCRCLGLFSVEKS